MDNLKEYIKMCEKAKEIQKKWKPLIGDFVSTKGMVEGRSYNWETYLFGKNKWAYYSLPFERYGYISSLNGFGGSCKIGVKEKLVKIAQGMTDGAGVVTLINNVIFCPRQDQLQEMLKDKYAWSKKFPHDLIWDFSSFIQDNEKINSMEQLWLAFVMKEKFNKIWNGEDWINV